ncbi:MAG: hypothetical protein ABSF12_14690 [Bryobacteraceae bacterium]|jgi:hypothetical protein
MLRPESTTSLPGSRKGSALIKTALTTLKTPVAPPMASARIAMVNVVTKGRRAWTLRLWEKSCFSSCASSTGIDHARSPSALSHNLKRAPAVSASR